MKSQREKFKEHMQEAGISGTPEALLRFMNDGLERHQADAAAIDAAVAFIAELQGALLDGVRRKDIGKIVRKRMGTKKLTHTEIRANQIDMGHPIYTIMLFHILDRSEHDATIEEIRKELRHMDDRYSHAAAEELYKELRPHVQRTVDLVNKFNELNTQG
jgi:putative aminopeptidase FrvX